MRQQIDGKRRTGHIATLAVGLLVLSLEGSVWIADAVSAPAGTRARRPPRPITGFNRKAPAPGELNFVSGDGTITITWDRGAEASDRFMGYRIFRRMDGRAPFREITPLWPDGKPGLLATNQFTDRGLANGQSYSYYIQAVYRGGYRSGRAYASIALPALPSPVTPPEPTPVAPPAPVTPPDPTPVAPPSVGGPSVPVIPAEPVPGPTPATPPAPPVVTPSPASGVIGTPASSPEPPPAPAPTEGPPPPVPVTAPPPAPPPMAPPVAPPVPPTPVAPPPSTDTGDPPAPPAPVQEPTPPPTPVAPPPVTDPPADLGAEVEAAAPTAAAADAIAQVQACQQALLAAFHRHDVDAVLSCYSEAYRREAAEAKLDWVVYLNWYSLNFVILRIDLVGARYVGAADGSRVTQTIQIRITERDRDTGVVSSYDSLDVVTWVRESNAWRIVYSRPVRLTGA